MRILVLARSARTRERYGSALESVTGVGGVEAVATATLAQQRLDRGGIHALFVEATALDDVGVFIRQLAKYQPTPSCIVLVEEGYQSEASASAILAGAVAVIPVPKAAGPSDLSALLSGAARRLTQYHISRSTNHSRELKRGELSSAQSAPAVQGRFAEPVRLRRELLAIGCSTGGPPALAVLLQNLPRTFQLPIVIVQHMGADHVPFLADTLARATDRVISVPQSGDAVEDNHVYVAGGGVHLLVTRRVTELRWALSDSPPEHNCRPAVDPLFRSIAKTCGGAALGLVLTGMGTDGALGAKAMADTGAPILVQDAASSVVWGMPGAAYSLGAASAVLPLVELVKEMLLWLPR